MKEKIPKLEKQLQQVGSLGFVGTGGIGKSTFAAALSDHISHQFDATVFVNDLKDESCRFVVRHKLQNVKVSPETKTLIEAREILTQLQQTQNVLIVVDNINKASQLKELLGDHEFERGEGSKFIATSREWKSSLGAYVPMVGKVEVQTLNEQQSLELFRMHAFCNTNQLCLPYLKYVVQKIVDACDGLPLSLEVMGSSLNGEKRLRIWERRLQRLLKGRDDQGGKRMNTWRSSFDELNEREKTMFLDISCFFCKDSSIGGLQFTQERILRYFDDVDDDDDNIIEQALEKLRDNSLLKVDENGVLDMHDQLQSMGRMIVEKEYQGSRIWDFSSSTFVDYCNQKVCGTNIDIYF